jgi:uncharacterized protein YkwD
MLHHKKIGIVLVIISVVLFSSLSCGGGVSTEEYESVTNDLADARAQVSELQAEISLAHAAEAEHQTLSAAYDELKKRNDAGVKELESLEAQYAALNDDYEDIEAQNETYLGQIASLQTQLQAALAAAEPPEDTAPEINERNIEEAMFARINSVRKAAGLNELTLGTNLPTWSVENSQDMLVAKRGVEFTDYLVPFQATFIAAGYSSVDRIVNAAMLSWQSNSLQYQNNILADGAIYGAVGVAKSGDIYYITFLGSNYP